MNKDTRGNKKKRRVTKVITNTPWAYTNEPGVGEYIYCKRKLGGYVRTKKLREGLLIDLDSEGEIIGVEIY